MSITASTKTKYSDIKDIALIDFLGVPAEQTLKAHEIWKDQPTVVIVIRRPGCQFCREEAKIFHENRQTIEQSMGMKMVCVMHEKEGSDTFQNEFWHGKVYFDPEKAFYKALGGGRLREGGWEQMIRPSFWVNLVRNKQSGVKGNFEGDGRILGGLLVVNADDGGIAYEHIEKVWGDIAHADKVLEACSRVSGVALNKDTSAKAQKDHDALHQKMQQSSVGKGQAGEGAACAAAAPTSSNSAGATTA
ncbi:hypothetical protein BC939DRAFT_475515 [Gamsiella multidivaricata]|uniref:uncharacterized protein n=1 Tax=Gamsiella multidivaricata TaxID=101098 RepID=UPI00222019DD|nr:uncharacterized protein BC939DRAFT_475515 [Gamsiella multidivaricata]KAG0369803.1 hypothetical protein BGZ54_008798 [Gamsiella multidivaricata]KAI7827151.1 hypothetical protein BC939DRAFT_475515 [Gamsiella multidivaricata]